MGLVVRHDCPDRGFESHKYMQISNHVKVEACAYMSDVMDLMILDIMASTLCVGLVN